MNLQKIHLNILACCVLAILITSCSSSTKEQSLEAIEEQKEPEISELASWLDIDTTASVVTWIGSKPNGQHNGIIPVFSGQLAVYDSAIVGGNFEMFIPGLKIMDLISDVEKHEKLKNHLISEDFFEADTFPTASFHLTLINPFDSTFTQEDKTEFKSDYQPAKASEFRVSNPTHLISGNLTLKGITRNITFPAEIVFNSGKVKAEAKFNIDRTDWDVSYSNESSVLDKARDKFIYNTVNVGFYIETR